MMANTKNLPQDLVIEILSRVPAQFLWSLRCVSKAWFRLLTRDILFANLHFNRSIKLNTNNPIALASRIYGENTIFYLTAEDTDCNKAIRLNFNFHVDDIVGICNGMLCLSRSRIDEVYIWNPLTQDHVIIPSSPTPYRIPECYMYPTGYGFGFHQGTNQYKVVRVIIKSVYRVEISVYTLGVDSNWRPIEEDNTFMVVLNKTPNPLVGGALHWLSCGTTDALFPNQIVAFDLKYEICREILFPRAVVFDDPLSLDVLGELGGLLCVFCTAPRSNIHVWVMHEYGELSSWKKQLIITSDEISVPLTFLEPLAILKCGEILSEASEQEELTVYNQKTNSIEIHKGSGVRFYSAYTYLRSFLSPRLIVEADYVQIERNEA